MSDEGVKKRKSEETSWLNIKEARVAEYVRKKRETWSGIRLPPIVLPDEEYEAKLEEAINDTYYPDLKRLRVMAKLLPARAARDGQLVERLESELAEMTPATLLQKRRSARDDMRGAFRVEAHISDDDNLKKETTNHETLSLGDLQAIYTAEDVVSFFRILEKESRDRAKRLSWMLEESAKHNLKMDRIKNELKAKLAASESDYYFPNGGSLGPLEYQFEDERASRPLLQTSHSAQSMLMFSNQEHGFHRIASDRKREEVMRLEALEKEDAKKSLLWKRKMISFRGEAGDHYRLLLANEDEGGTLSLEDGGGRTLSLQGETGVCENTAEARSINDKQKNSSESKIQSPTHIKEEEEEEEEEHRAPPAETSLKKTAAALIAVGRRETGEGSREETAARSGKEVSNRFFEFGVSNSCGDAVLDLRASPTRSELSIAPAVELGMSTSLNASAMLVNEIRRVEEAINRKTRVIPRGTRFTTEEQALAEKSAIAKVLPMTEREQVELQRHVNERVCESMLETGSFANYKTQFKKIEQEVLQTAALPDERGGGVGGCSNPSLEFVECDNAVIMTQREEKTTAATVYKLQDVSEREMVAERLLDERKQKDRMKRRLRESYQQSPRHVNSTLADYTANHTIFDRHSRRKRQQQQPSLMNTQSSISWIGDMLKEGRK